MTRLGTAAASAVGAIVGIGCLLVWQAQSPAPTSRAGVEQVVHDYLLAHPEVIPAAMERLRDRETGQAVAAIGPALAKPYAGAWAGNPKGDVTLVEFYDYNCGYCRASLPAIRQLVAEDPNLRVVFRELPVLAANSRTAARASIAAAAAGQATFTRFHDALYAGGRVSGDSIAAAARAAGLNLAAADTAAADAEIARNMEAAGRLGVGGTPAWIVGNRVLSGALPPEELKRAIAAARAG